MKICVECHEGKASYWDNNFCEDCFIKILEMSVKHEIPMEIQQIQKKSYTHTVGDA